MMIDDEKRRQLLVYRQQRDLIAQRLGAAVIELSAVIRRAEAQIAESLAAEAALEGELLQQQGVPVGVRATIDRGTGEVSISKGAW